MAVVGLIAVLLLMSQIWDPLGIELRRDGSIAPGGYAVHTIYRVWFSTFTWSLILAVIEPSS